MSVGTMPEIIHEADSMPMSRSMQMAIVLSRTFSVMLSSIVLHFMWHTPMPRAIQTPLAVSSTICEGPPNESLPKTTRVHESKAMRVLKGLELSPADGLRGSSDDWISSLRVCIFIDRLESPGYSGIS